MSISEAVNRIESLVDRDMELARRIEDMRNNLMKRGKKKYLITVACPPYRDYGRDSVAHEGGLFTFTRSSRRRNPSGQQAQNQVLSVFSREQGRLPAVPGWRRIRSLQGCAG